MTEKPSAPLFAKAPPPQELSVENPEKGSWKVLIIDDEQEVHDVTMLVLRNFEFEGKSLEILHAYSATEGIRMFGEHDDIAVVLVDVVMDGDDAGLRLIRHVRQSMGNQFVRIILRTGQPGVAPEREVITRYDINDYKEKTELSAQKLFSVMISALRGYRDIKALDDMRRGVERMLETATALFRARTVPRFAEIALGKLVSLFNQEQAILHDKLGGGVFIAQSSQIFSRGEVLAHIGSPAMVAPGLHAILLHQGSDIEPPVDTMSILISTRYGEEYLIRLSLGRPTTALDHSLAELFRLKATLALEHLIVLQKNQDAQRQAINALARIVEERNPERLSNRTQHSQEQPDTFATLTESISEIYSRHNMTGATGFVDFLYQLATQAEIGTWGSAERAAAHIVRIGLYSNLIARQAGLEPEFCEAIRIAAGLHDIGNLFSPTYACGNWYLADSPSRRAASGHALSGKDFLLCNSSSTLPTSILRMAADIAMHHHEAWVGSGYPNGLSGKSIPISARIVAMADFFDTHTHTQLDGEKPPLSDTEVRELIAASSAYYFDPELSRVFLESFDKLLSLRASLIDLEV